MDCDTWRMVGIFVRRWQLAALLAIALGAALVGCKGNAQGEAQAEIDPTSAEPAELLAGMLDAYAQAESYSDRAEIIFRHTAAGTREEDITELASSYERPNRLRLALGFQDAEILLADDGETVRAKIVAEESENFDNQFMVRAAPEKLHCGSLYEATTLVVPYGDPGGPPMSVLEGPYVRMELLPLGLLLGDSQLPAIIADGKDITELRPREFEGHACRRVRIEAPEGEFTFWIDRENLVLRRIEYPTASLTEGRVQRGLVRDVELVVDFHDAQLNGPLPEETFALEQPAGAKVVTRFVRPLLETPPENLGQQVEEFTLMSLGGQPVGSSHWQGKSVLLYFFDNHPDCGVGAQHVEQIHEKIEQGEWGDEIVLGVCTESVETLSNEELRRLVAEWGASFPVVRDPAAAGLEQMNVQEAPAVVVLDGDRRIQYAMASAPPELSEELAAVLGELAEGNDLAQELLDRYAELLQLYEQALAAAQAGSEDTIIELPDLDQPVPERDDPRHLQVEEVWSTAEIEFPGNLLVAPGEAASDDDRVFVLDGWRTIAELNDAGQVVRRIELELPEQVAINSLRQTIDSEGRAWFAGFSRLGQQAFLFDDQWRLVMSYPDAETPHPGVQDVLLADLDGGDEGPLRMYVAFWQNAGVHAVRLDGVREWSNRSVQPAISLSVSPANPVGWQNLLVTSTTGSVVPINRFGNAEAAIEIPPDGVHTLFNARQWLPRGATLAGIAFGADGKVVMKGITSEFNEDWQYALAAGLPPGGVQPVTSGMLVEGLPMQWLFVGADGSLHLVSSDGNQFDWFHYGARVEGVGIARLGGQPLLLVASDGQVTALRVSRKAGGAE